MINIIDKSHCCGCGACANICARKAISFKADEEGFYYPVVNGDLCVECGLCESVCPMCAKRKYKATPLYLYSATNTSESICSESSSGGLFSAFADIVLAQGGVVFGARFNDLNEVIIDYTETIEGLKPFRGSKYIQAKVGNAYTTARHFLQQGRIVLFTGTPCQVSALHLFLRKYYPNLISIDVICHGVPSTKVWQLHVSSLCKQDLCQMNFRDKTYGWRQYSYKYTFTNKCISHVHWKDPYFKAFHSSVIIRPSCFCCPSKGGRSGSDITLGDYWGIEKAHPQQYTPLGVSMLIVNTEKGQSLVKEGKYKIKIHNQPISDIMRLNNNYYVSPLCPANREEIFHQINSGNKLKEIFKKSIYSRVINKIRHILKHI